MARLKLNRKYMLISSRPVSDIKDPTGEYDILEDSDVYLKKSNSAQWDDSVTYRIIRVKFTHPRPKPSSPKSHARKYQDEMVLITNDFTSDPLVIANEYKTRWSIEVFFKFLKQNLSFSHLLSVNLNGIKVMLYMTLIMALLVKLFELGSGLGPKMAIQEMQIQIANWLYLQNQAKDKLSTAEPLSNETHEKQKINPE